MTSVVPSRDHSGALWPHRDPAILAEQRATRLLDVAAHVFYEKGYAPTTMREVADRAGLLKGSIYHHFASKQEMLFEIIWSVHNGITAQMAPLVDATTDPVGRLRAILERHVLYNAKNVAWTTVFYNDFTALEDEHRALVVRERDRYDSMLTELVEQGQRDGTVTADVPARLATFGLLGLVNSLHRWYRPAGTHSAEVIAAAFATMALDGLLVRDPSRNG